MSPVVVLLFDIVASHSCAASSLFSFFNFTAAPRFYRRCVP